MKLKILIIMLVAGLFIAPAYAQEGVDLSILPELLADALNISEFAAGIMVSLLLCCFFMFPTIMITKGKEQSTLALLLVGIGSLGVCVAIGWFPVWLLGILTLTVTLSLASKAKGLI